MIDSGPHHMNANESLKQFKAEFQSALDKAVTGGVPVQNLILELGEEQFRLQLHVFQSKAERAAQDLAGKILPAGSMPLTFTKTNGSRR